MEMMTLNNGVEMPLEGFGVFQITDAAVCERAVLDALDVGYRLIDTASSYQNEEAVGRAIKKSGIPRSDLFITTKAYMQEMGYERTKAAFQSSLDKLGLDYLDLYLIHMPFGDYYGSWRAMEELYKEGRIRAIGVCNFMSDRIIDFGFNVDVMPAIDQIELHPFYQREPELAVLKEYGIKPTAWAPFAEGLNGMFTNPVMKVIASEHGKTVGQVILRWNIERGVSIIPKSVHRSRMEENFDIWDFSLTPDDMKAIATLDLGRPQMLDTRSPAEVRRVYDYLNNPVLTTL
ncbi:2,5-diketo-D-gluconic acid reductase [Mesosutterella multiformis]|jgi:2,5-diketo-D-gluconate reductase A|uniref:2,5-diketo-D-gluconic acid reductase n=1 Tax=Mesosutterella multiformis TaxID=2259133 RepID=A0A388SEB4_9BURK|nr:aldo/keto reductase [Mesosutterella multiformis]GBO94616.1 2,5-diketo-D-gluconic acid reductase [Mesosutterella multiformis]